MFCTIIIICLILLVPAFSLLWRRIAENRKIISCPQEPVSCCNFNSQRVEQIITPVPKDLDSILKSLETAVNNIPYKGEKAAVLFNNIRLLRETHNSPLLVTVLGEFSAGKSTFINALLGEKLLPMKQRETTATITKLQYGAERKMVMHYKNGTKDVISLASDADPHFENFLIENFKETDNILDLISQVDIKLNTDILRSIDIADTPGFNSEYNRHTEITTEFIKYSDLIIWLFNAKQFGKASEINKLQEHCKMFKPIGIVNQIDRINLKDGESVQNALANSLVKYDGLFEKIFFVSALNGLNGTNGTYAGSGIPDFINYLTYTIIPEAKSRKDKSILNKVAQIGGELNESLQSLSNKVNMTQRNIQAIEALAVKVEEFNAKWKLITSQWEADSNDETHVLAHVKLYFLIIDPPMSILQNASRYQEQIKKSQAQLIKLKQKNTELERRGRDLEQKYKFWKNEYDTYSQKGFGIKKYGDDFCEWITGAPFSEERSRLNSLAEGYNKSQIGYNNKVDIYNNRLQTYNNQVNKLNDSLTYFIDTTIRRQINTQFEQIQILQQEIKSKQHDYQVLVGELVVLREEMKYYYEKIVPVFLQIAYYLGITEHELKGKFVNFAGLINIIRSQLKVSDSLDWTRIYNRSTIEEAIEQRFRKPVKFAAPTETEKAKRQTVQV